MQATTDDLFYSRTRKLNITRSWQDVEKSLSCVCDVLTDMLAQRSSVDGVYMLYYPCGRNIDRSQVSFIWASVLPYTRSILGLLVVVYGCLLLRSTCWGILPRVFSGTAVLFIFRFGIIFHACPKSDISGRKVLHTIQTYINSNSKCGWSLNPCKYLVYCNNSQQPYTWYSYHPYFRTAWKHVEEVPVLPQEEFVYSYCWCFILEVSHGRWTSGSSRMLLLLVREFEFRRGEILNLFAK